jgi:hypothetical protein
MIFHIEMQEIAKQFEEDKCYFADQALWIIKQSLLSLYLYNL